jgi:hypothetical protein
MALQSKMQDKLDSEDDNDVEACRETRSYANASARANVREVGDDGEYALIALFNNAFELRVRAFSGRPRSIGF